MIIATDQPGHLRDALHKRIDLSVGLGFYTDRELKEVVEVIAKASSLLLSPQACGLIAGISCGLPRRARQHLRNVKRHNRDAESRQLDFKDVREFLDFMGIDEVGLGPMDFRYLKALDDRGSASLESLALMLGTDVLYVSRQIEPVLVRRNLVAIAPGGRQLTPAGKTLVEQHRKDNPEPTPEKADDNDEG